jgi:hypothetical protein
MLETVTLLHSAGENRRRTWGNGAAPRVLNDLEQQRTPNDPLRDLAPIGSFRAPKVRVTEMDVQMDVEQGLPKPLSLGKPSSFGLYKPNSGGGGGIRTCDQGLMSSWL